VGGELVKAGKEWAGKRERPLIGWDESPLQQRMKEESVQSKLSGEKKCQAANQQQTNGAHQTKVRANQ
jgi:hypothetical protein